MNVSTSSSKTYPYGPNLLGLYIALVFFSFCSAVAYYMVAVENSVKGMVILPLALFMTIAAFVLTTFYSRASAPRAIVFHADHVQIPERRLSSRIVDLKYGDLINVELTKMLNEEVLLITHRSGKLKLPRAMLHKTDVHELHWELMNRRNALVLPTGASASAI